MSVMLSTFIVGVLLATISGLAILAIKHHDVYEDIFNKILFCVFVAFLLISAVSVGYEYGVYTTKKAIENIPSNFVSPKEEMFRNIRWYSISIFLLSQIYLYLLSYLGRKIKHSQEKQNQNKK